MRDHAATLLFRAAVLTLACMLGLTGLTAGCSLFGGSGSFWPVVKQCAPSPASLIDQAADVLLAGGDYRQALKDLALSNGAAAVECAVKAAIDSLLGKVGAGPTEQHAVARGRAFLAENQFGQ